MCPSSELSRAPPPSSSILITPTFPFCFTSSRGKFTGLAQCILFPLLFNPSNLYVPIPSTKSPLLKYLVCFLFSWRVKLHPQNRSIAVLPVNQGKEKTMASSLLYSAGQLRKTESVGNGTGTEQWMGQSPCPHGACDLAERARQQISYKWVTWFGRNISFLGLL